MFFMIVYRKVQMKNREIYSQKYATSNKKTLPVIKKNYCDSSIFMAAAIAAFIATFRATRVF